MLEQCKAPIEAVVLAEGEAKGMKTSVCEEAERTLVNLGFVVVRDDAGSFFRKTTVGALAFLDAAGVEDPTQEDCNKASWDVLEAGIPYDTQRPWELHTRRIDSWVATISSAKHVQDAGRDWWATTADRAVEAGANALVLDGRNPRARLETWLAKNAVGITAELFCVCDPRTAAIRTLKGRGVDNPTSAEVAEARQSIVDRRARDRNRAELPYVDPAEFVRYRHILHGTPGSSAARVMERAVRLGEPGRPLPVRIDTGKLRREPMNAAVGDLVLAAHALVQ